MSLMDVKDFYIITHRNDYLFSDNMTPTQQHQAFDEVLYLEKRFAAEVYAQRYYDKYPKVYYNGKKKEKG